MRAFPSHIDVINPLQHLPVIGTIYRAITHEHIGTVEKIAGDTLYGGMWGAVASVADVAFEGITGKSFEDTALAFSGATTSRTQQWPAPWSSHRPSPLDTRRCRHLICRHCLPYNGCG